MASTTLAALYARVLPLLGPYQPGTTNLSTSGADPARWLLASQLFGDPSSARWKDAWVYLPSPPVVTTPTVVKILEVFPQFGGAVTDALMGGGGNISAGMVLTLTDPLPVLTSRGVTGATTFIREACRDVWFEDVIDITTVAGQYAYSLSAQANWLDSEALVTGLYSPSLRSSASYPQQPDQQRYGGLTFEGGVPTLRLRSPWRQSGNTAQLGVIRPAYSLVNGSESTSGPSVDADVVDANADDLVAVTLLRCYRYLAVAPHLTDVQRKVYAGNGRNSGLVAQQEAWVQEHVKHYLPRDEMPAQGEKAAA